MSRARDLTLGKNRGRGGAPKMRPPFYALHRATLAPSTELPELLGHLRAAEALTERRRLSEGAVYVAALRRWELLAGAPYDRALAAEAERLAALGDLPYRQAYRAIGDLLATGLIEPTATEEQQP